MSLKFMHFSDEQIKKIGLKVVNSRGIVHIDTIGLKLPFTEIMRRFVYLLLDKYERDGLVVISGLPYCFLPNAIDHVSYSAEKNKKYRKVAICKDCRFKKECPGLRMGLELTNYSLTPVIDAPQDLAIEVNTNCNLRCRFCLHAYREDENLSFGKIKQALKDSWQLGVRSVRFTGGEPLLRKDICNILAYAKKLGFYVILNTNAVLLSAELLRQFEKNVDNILISLCGYDMQTENMVTGNGSHLGKKFSNILKISNSKIPYKRLGTVIFRTLIDNFEAYAYLLSKLKIRVWELYRPMTSSSLPGDIFYDISAKDYEGLLKKMVKLKKKGINVSIVNPLPFCVTSRRSLFPLIVGSRYDDGYSRLVLDASGYFKPSYFIDKNIGSSFYEAWNSDFMKNIRNYNYIPASCKPCEYVRWCLGGSRFLAHEAFGKYSSYDPLYSSSKKNYLFKT